MLLERSLRGGVGPLVPRARREARVAAAAGTARRTGVGVAEATDLFAVLPADFQNQIVDASTLILAYTLVGDATLDGAVSLPDFSRLAAHFGRTSARWSQGDFNYDGNVSLEDFNLLAVNFGSAAAGPGVTPQDWAALAPSVPEPCAALAAVLAAPLLPTRRRSSGSSTTLSTPAL